jgi:hypothetical protein
MLLLAEGGIEKRKYKKKRIMRELCVVIYRRA